MQWSIFFLAGGLIGGFVNCLMSWVVWQSWYQEVRDRVLLLVEASIQAYCAYDKSNPSVCNSANVTPPKGYDVVDCWTGVDAILGEDKTLECYGVVFRSQQSPYTYIFAFRGTDSFKDLLDDFAFDFTAFKPYTKDSLVPSGVEVESGFYRIYSDSDDEAKANSMQNQVFALDASPSMAKILVDPLVETKQDQNDPGS